MDSEISILFYFIFSRASWLTNDGSWSWQHENHCYSALSCVTRAGRVKTISHTLLLKFQMFLGSKNQMLLYFFCSFCWASMSWKCLVFLDNASRGLVTSISTFPRHQEERQRTSIFAGQVFIRHRIVVDLRHLWLCKTVLSQSGQFLIAVALRSRQWQCGSGTWEVPILKW